MFRLLGPTHVEPIEPEQPEEKAKLVPVTDVMLEEAQAKEENPAVEEQVVLMTKPLDVKPPPPKAEKPVKTEQDKKKEKEDKKTAAAPVGLNLASMYDDLIHDAAFIKEHKEGGRHVKQAVLLQHGLDMSADSWFYQDREGATPMPIQLWEAGYDVWLGNNRGTSHSKGTVDNKHPAEYWDFSFAEIGMHDLPAMAKEIKHQL